MRLSTRVAKLERLRTLTSASSPMERFQRAFNNTAIRLTGKGADQLAHDSADLVLKEMGESYFRTLSDSDAEQLRAALEEIAFGDDLEARKAAEQEVLASLDPSEGTTL
jgi:hypothetical protein